MTTPHFAKLTWPRPATLTPAEDWPDWVALHEVLADPATINAHLQRCGRLVSLPTAWLTFGQTAIHAPALLHYLRRRCRRPVETLYAGGRWLLLDGHHRALAAWLRGERWINARAAIWPKRRCY